jgi:hypothetical protein
MKRINLAISDLAHSKFTELKILLRKSRGEKMLADSALSFILESLHYDFDETTNILRITIDNQETTNTKTD